jgi:predicted nuclease of predicted toxin-antitoxin system
MRFLLDENADARLAGHLRGRGHDVTAVARDYPHALPDADVLALAVAEGRVLVTNDLDFGELIVRRRLPHAGVVLLRLRATDLATLTARLDAALAAAALTAGRFVVVTEDAVRVR